MIKRESHIHVVTSAPALFLTNQDVFLLDELHVVIISWGLGSTGFSIFKEFRTPVSPIRPISFTTESTGFQSIKISEIPTSVMPICCIWRNFLITVGYTGFLNISKSSVLPIWHHFLRVQSIGISQILLWRKCNISLANFISLSFLFKQSFPIITTIISKFYSSFLTAHCFRKLQAKDYFPPPQRENPQGHRALCMTLHVLVLVCDLHSSTTNRPKYCPFILPNKHVFRKGQYLNQVPSTQLRCNQWYII